MDRDSLTNRPYSELLGKPNTKIRYDENMNYMQPLRRPDSSSFVPVRSPTETMPEPVLLNPEDGKGTSTVVNKGSSAYNAIKYMDTIKRTKSRTSTIHPSPPPSSIVSARLGIISVHQQVGKGGFSRCYLSKSSNNNIFATKTICKKTAKSTTVSQARQEFKIHRNLHHPSIVEFVDKFESPDHIFIILEYCPNSTLQELLEKNGPFSEGESAHYLFYIVGAVEYLHNFCINHGDIKLSNVLLDHNMHPKLSDFGFAQKLSSPTDNRTTFCGTLAYTAPELLCRPCAFGLPADIWSLGVMAYTLMYGRTPFDGSNSTVVRQRIKAHDLRFPRNRPDISIAAINFILCSLTPNPQIRPNIMNLNNSTWFEQYFDTTPADQRKSQLLELELDQRREGEAAAHRSSGFKKDVKETNSATGTCAATAAAIATATAAANATTAADTTTNAADTVEETSEQTHENLVHRFKGRFIHAKSKVTQVRKILRRHATT